MDERMDRIEAKLIKMDERLDQVMRVMEQLVHMVAATNSAMADLRAEVTDLRAEVADLRGEMSNMEERLTIRMTGIEEQMRHDRLIRDGGSRHFAQEIGVLRRDVDVLKPR